MRPDDLPATKAGGAGVRPSMQPGRLEEPAAFRRGDLVVQGPAVAFDLDRDFDARLAERPDAPEHAGETADFRAADGQHDIAGVQAGALRRAAIREADDHDAIFDLRRVKPEPGSRRPVGPPVAQEVIEDRLEEIDRHDHVEMARRAFFAPLLELERADAEQLPDR